MRFSGRSPYQTHLDGFQKADTRKGIGVTEVVRPVVLPEEPLDGRLPIQIQTLQGQGNLGHTALLGIACSRRPVPPA
jgi:hypothetical protein